MVNICIYVGLAFTEPLKIQIDDYYVLYLFFFVQCSHIRICKQCFISINDIWIQYHIMCNTFKKKMFFHVEIEI